MVAAVARMFRPGCKWDHVPVLYGPEGLGKTYWIEVVFRRWATSLGRIDNKDTLLVCQQSWAVIADEHHSMRKADQDAQKEFLTRTADMFRMPYDRETLLHPRHWVVWSTTNDQTFLTRQQGNRRYLIVHCQDTVDFDSITDVYVDQLWAEAVYLYRAGEKLYLDPTESALAAEHREPFVEEDTLTGIVLDYLETPVPTDWWERRPESRQSYLFERATGLAPAGEMTIDRVCSMQIWVEALNRRKGDARRHDLTEITNVLKRLPGWRAAPGRTRLPGYGTQLVFIREDLI
jgi:predicted P-loop ATPase